MVQHMKIKKYNTLALKECIKITSIKKTDHIKITQSSVSTEKAFKKIQYPFMIKYSTNKEQKEIIST